MTSPAQPVGAGADKDSPNKQGNTALSWAAEKGHLDCARLVVAVDADRAKTNKDVCAATSEDEDDDCKDRSDRSTESDRRSQVPSKL